MLEVVFFGNQSLAAPSEAHAMIDILAPVLTKVQTINTSIGSDRNAPLKPAIDLPPFVRDSIWFNDMPGEEVSTNLEEGI
ncbi:MULTISPECIES: hypothetical protein [Stappiaceae]|jgi:hypothetical protein|uniref:hypothetical protein n=1 Tax=Stappiaceae TaxID=2821832 RepID=UPI001445FF91|nr:MULTISPECIES: hypothetical protein [Stappiaceae]MEC9421103.1 hypothetical protein [Pseudomonadota bacterium]MBO9463255.1 hypothetical protein [Labrenzia sp. R5_0]NKX68233.1 hypothetical protein [Labrenzia sp. 5N]UES41919.1 hypothetical protein GFC08_28290 [Roseibium aggregatum]UES48036.1 hypothetical protein GFK90_29325 [Roseibium aggregatum]